MEQFEKLDIQPFGVNPAAASSHLKYRDKFDFPFPLLSDKGATVARAYGATKIGSMIRRSVFLVDHDGKIIFSKTGSPPTDEILRVLKPGGN